MEPKKIYTALCSFGMSGVVFHAPIINEHSGFSLYGVWERTKNLAEEKYPSIKTFRSLDEMLANDAIELVIVNTPNATHFEYSKKALQAGKHIIVEKPFTINIEEAEELIAVANTVNRKISVYHNRRWDSDFKTVRKVVEEKLLGEVVEAEIHFDRFKEELSLKAHKETPGPGAGILYDLGSHLIDQALQLFGMPQAVFADVIPLRKISIVDDYFELLLFYPGRRVRLKASYVAKEPIPAFVLHGTKGSFIKTRGDVQEAALQANKIPGRSGWGIEPESEMGLLHATINGKEIHRRINSEPGNYMEFYNGVYESIRNGKQSPVSAQDGLDVIKIINAAFKSNSEKRVIEI